MMMRTAILLVALLAPSLAAAQQTPLPSPDMMMQGTAEERAACRPDVRKHCSNIDITKNETHLGCLKLNGTKLSKACKQVLEKHGQL